ncbi:MAG: pantetheine-phosphate adenylyltransferase [Actinomycetota bacterium]
MIALCPGTYDPVTNGHLDIVRRAASLFDRVVMAVIENPAKATLFEVEERVTMLRDTVGDLDGVEVDSFSGLLVDYARQKGAGVIVKGLRAVSDFDYELQMAQMNRHLAEVETVFVPTSAKWSYLSSSLVKEVARYGGDVSGLVPEPVVGRLKEKLT